MTVRVMSVLALAVAAGSASAGTLATSANSPEISGFRTGYSSRADVPVSLAGQSTWDLHTDASNTNIFFDLSAAMGLGSGVPVTMTGIGWNLDLDTLNAPAGTSWLSEVRLAFGDSAGTYGLFVRPGAGAANNVVGTGSFSSGGQIDLSDNAIPDIFLPDGILRIELHETFDDVADVIDGLITGGGVTVTAVPAPGALALLGIGGLVIARRRR